MVVRQTSTTTSSTTRKDMVLTSSTGQWSRPEHRGCWRYQPVHPRRAPPPPALLRLPPLLQQRRPAQRSPTLLRPPPLQRRRPRVSRSLAELGVGAPVAPGCLQQWGMDYGFQPAPPPCPTRPRRPLRRAPLTAPPAYKEDYSSASALEQWVLDYSTQDNLPPEVWSLRPSASSPPASWRGCAASAAAQQG
jgi:hypothetical protein